MISRWPAAALRGAALAALLALLRLHPVGAAEGEGFPAPRILDVRVWYYPPEGKRPALVLWWEPRKIRYQRRATFSRRGIFRVRAVIRGGIPTLRGDRWEVVNWVSIVFRDANSNLFDLPYEARRVSTPLPPGFSRLLGRYVEEPEGLSEPQRRQVESFAGTAVKDLYWRVPYNFVHGPFDFQVGVWYNPTAGEDLFPRRSLHTHLVDQTDFFILGEMGF